ncbi:MAG: DUF2281 domain-containing protein [Methanothrix sp.]|nr:MAG: DUF2281 domain-containing protein [Methanothrix sp.]
MSQDKIADDEQSEKSIHPLKLDWRGALEDMKDQYTSVELQHKISEWRTETQYKD